jgi:hypothetical protein
MFPEKCPNCCRPVHVSHLDKVFWNGRPMEYIPCTCSYKIVPIYRHDEKKIHGAADTGMYSIEIAGLQII